MSINVNLPTGIVINYDVWVDASLNQRVTLEGPQLTRKEHTGSGTGGIGNGSFTLAGPIGGSSPVTVSCHHHKDGQWRQSQERHEGPHQDTAAPPDKIRVFHRVRSEEGGDGDWNDSVTWFYWYIPR